MYQIIFNLLIPCSKDSKHFALEVLSLLSMRQENKKMRKVFLKN